ncbi:MAG: CotH kinase family protein, partial [Flavobacteriales bacterium]|nr:CotH kinase family protein [Flavobacteriales bacterium]
MRNQIVFLFFLILLAGVQAQGQIVINEFMAANSSAVYDPDFNESSDWLELYNSGVSDVDLSGYYVTDNLSDTTKWMIPEGTILPAGEFLVIWADGMNTGLHTSFKLSSIGEELGIYTAAEELLDGIIFPLQATDISYGREMDGSDTWVWFAQSTPGASNNDAQSYEGVTYYEPAFSVHGGFYSGTLSVALSSLGGEIRYTLDGREPTMDDPLYTEPLLVDSTSFIRARVFEENFIAGPTITHSYFFDDTFAERGLPVISLVTDPDFFWDPEIGLYVQDFKPDWEHPLNIEFFENDAANQAVFNERAGVKINGQNSWVLPQKMLGIYFRNQYGAGHLEYPLFADRDRAVFDDFVLRAGGSDWAYSMIRDGVCQSLPQDNADVGYQGFRQSIVFINGEYMGIHNIRSRLNDGFVEENYGVASGTYDLIANDGEIEEGDDIAYELMDDLFNADLTVQANFDALDSVVDLQNFADYWITEIWSSNQSWAHNVMLWKPHDGGKWQFLLGDLDRGISGATNDAINSFSVPAEGDYWDNYAQRWLEHVFARPEYAAYFVQRFNDHLYTSFHPHQVTREMHRFADPIRTEMAYHADRWAGHGPWRRGS